MWNSIETLSPVQWGAVIGASLVGALVDLRCRKLPNALTVPVFVSGVAWWAWTGGVSGAGESLLAALALMIPFFVLFAFAGGGAGDAKMMAGIGAWLGLEVGLMALLLVMVSGVVLGLAWAAAQGRLREVLRNLGAMFAVFVGAVTMRQGVLTAGRVATPKQGMVAMPYGLAILMGVCATAGVMLLWF